MQTQGKLDSKANTGNNQTESQKKKRKPQIQKPAKHQKQQIPLQNPENENPNQ